MRRNRRDFDRSFDADGAVVAWAEVISVHSIG